MNFDFEYIVLERAQRFYSLQLIFDLGLGLLFQMFVIQK